MHRVKRAIIMAAGIGSRMRPLTLQTPKPLIRVNGVRMIDTVITGLHRQGIGEIAVVVGHLKEQFRSLETEHPDLRLIDNPWYNSCNNIASLYAARELLDEDVMILDADQLIFRDEVLSAVFDRSGYNAVWTEEPTKEWLLTVEDGRVKACSRVGGEQGWQLYSISRWTKEDAQRLRNQLETEFEEKKNRQIYWDDVPLFCYPETYTLGIRQMQRGDVVEIDSLEELKAVDNSYALPERQGE